MLEVKIVLMVKVKEPRPGVKSGSIEGSICLPYSECINLKDNSFLNKKILDKKFKSLGISRVIMLCFPVVLP